MAETATYSTTPFISYDGPDSNQVRAEVKVLVGYMKVIDIEKSSKGKSANYIFRADNNPHKMNGWVPETEEAIVEKLRYAYDNREPIHVRIETKRKNHVDRATPLSEVAPARDMEAAQLNTFKSLAAVKLEGDEEWTISKMALTRLDEDPELGSNSAYGHSLEDLNAAKTNNSKDARGGNASSGAKSGGYHSVESTPWFSRNHDGSVNIGSSAVSIPLTIHAFVFNFVKDHNLDIAEARITTLTKAILSSANKIQVAAYEDYENKIEEPDLALGSHTRARSVIFDVIRMYYPITEEVVASSENLLSWKEKVENKALSMWKWSIETVTPYV